MVDPAHRKEEVFCPLYADDRRIALVRGCQLRRAPSYSEGAGSRRLQMASDPWSPLQASQLFRKETVHECGEWLRWTECPCPGECAPDHLAGTWHPTSPRRQAWTQWRSYTLANSSVGVSRPLSSCPGRSRAAPTISPTPAGLQTPQSWQSTKLDPTKASLTT